MAADDRTSAPDKRPVPDFARITELEIARDYRDPHHSSCRNPERGCPPGMYLAWKELEPGEALVGENGDLLPIFTPLGMALLDQGDLKVTRRIWKACTCAHRNFLRMWDREMQAWRAEQKTKAELAEKAAAAGLVLPSDEKVVKTGPSGLVAADGKTRLR